MQFQRSGPARSHASRVSLREPHGCGAAFYVLSLHSCNLLGLLCCVCWSSPNLRGQTSDGWSHPVCLRRRGSPSFAPFLPASKRRGTKSIPFSFSIGASKRRLKRTGKVSAAWGLVPSPARTRGWRGKARAPWYSPAACALQTPCRHGRLIARMGTPKSQQMAR